MMGSFLTRGLVMVLGYTYPAYECFKTVEKNKPEIDHLRFWCQYWILVAVLTVLERIGDTFISWLPMYSEAKLAFFVYLWYPKTRGTAYVYDTFLRPYVAKHETEIDRNLLELRTRAGDMAVMYWQKAASYGQTSVFEIMQFVASRSQRPHAAQQQRQPPPAPVQQRAPQQPRRSAGEHQPPPAPVQQPAPQQPQRSAGKHQPPPAPVQQPAPQQPQCSAGEHQPPPAPVQQPAPQKPQRSPAAAAKGQQDKPSQETGPNNAPPKADANNAHAQAAIPSPAIAEAPKQSTEPNEEQAMEVKQVPVPANEGADPPPPETVTEETIRVTCVKLRKTRSTRGR